MTEEVARFVSVRKKFRDVEALSGMSFEVFPGEVFGCIGPNGSGKTTAIRHMLGFYRPDRGSVQVFGHDPSTEFSQIGPGLGVMLEQPGLCDSLTPSEYLDFYAGLFGIARPHAQERKKELLELAGLTSRSEHRIAGFSKGMRQRLSLARCLINRPRLLLLDEPFDGIDVETRRHILDLLPRLAHEAGAAVFVTSHNLPEVDRVSDRIAIVNYGRIVALDRPDSLRELATRKRCVVIKVRDGPVDQCLDLHRRIPGITYADERRELRIESGDEEPKTDTVLRLLLAHGIGVSSITEERSTLEDAYFALTRGGEGSKW